MSPEKQTPEPQFVSVPKEHVEAVLAASVGTPEHAEALRKLEEVGAYVLNPTEQQGPTWGIVTHEGEDGSTVIGDRYVNLSGDKSNIGEALSDRRREEQGFSPPAEKYDELVTATDKEGEEKAPEVNLEAMQRDFRETDRLVEEFGAATRQVGNMVPQAEQVMQQGALIASRIRDMAHDKMAMQYQEWRPLVNNLRGVLDEYKRINARATNAAEPAQQKGNAIAAHEEQVAGHVENPTLKNAVYQSVIGIRAAAHKLVSSEFPNARRLEANIEDLETVLRRGANPNYIEEIADTVRRDFMRMMGEVQDSIRPVMQESDIAARNLHEVLQRAFAEAKKK